MTSGHASVLGPSGTRLAQRSPGDAIDPRALVGRQTTQREIRAGGACRVVTLGAADAQWLEENRTALMVKLYRYLAAEERSSPVPGGER